MNELSRSFEKARARFERRKKFFSKRISRWRKCGSAKQADKAVQLLTDAENYLNEIQIGMHPTAEGQSDEAVLKNKLREFRSIYAELYNLTLPEWRQWFNSVTVAFFVALVLRSFIFGLYHVPSGSAEPNILVGHRIWGNKMAYYLDQVKRGDLVIFDNPEFDYDKKNLFASLWQRYIGFPVPALGLCAGPDNWVKRVIAVPGDTLEGRVENGRTHVYLNGALLEEPYVNPYPLIKVKKKTGLFARSNFFGFAIPSIFCSSNKIAHYSYDPNVSFNDQPFYHLKERDVVRDPITQELVLSQSFTPTYVMKQGMHQEYIYNIDNFGPITIPPGMCWVMGDSRKNSRDSRYWGLLDQRLIHGRASFVMYSIDSEEPFWLFDFAKHPITFWTKRVRWGSFFTRLDTFNEPRYQAEEKMS
ncbi:signal peptidase I [Candidatus Babeliales bacterium]|nr:signal peptidase I [Candidatus Babeliales bacterium]